MRWELSLRSGLGSFGCLWGFRSGTELRLARAADSAETLLELVDAAFGVDELRLTRKERMRVGRNTHRDDVMFHAIDDFRFIGCLGRTRDEASASGHVYEDDWAVFWMKILFHGGRNSRSRYRRGGKREDARERPRVKRERSSRVVNACQISDMKRIPNTA